MLLICLCSDPLFAQTPAKLDTIEKTKVGPFDQVGYQLISRKRRLRKDANFHSTGFFIAPNVILTAGHNIFSTGWSKVDRIEIRPGRYGDSTSYDPIVISGEAACQAAIRVHPDYDFGSKNRIRYDYGIIIIPEHLIRNRRWPTRAAFELDSNYVLREGDSLHVAGFPASGGYNGSLMIYQKDTCGNIRTRSFEHDFDTHTGNSGSPIWVEVNGRRIIVGVHTFGGAGTTIARDDVQRILGWIGGR